jgi:hypothetical protein
MFSDYDDIKPKEKKELSEHQYMLLASHMFAFILKDRDYGKYLTLYHRSVKQFSGST